MRLSVTIVALNLVLLGRIGTALAFIQLGGRAIPRGLGSSDHLKGAYRSLKHGHQVDMALGASPSRSKAELKNEFFRCTEGVVEFGSTQGVEATIPGAPIASMNGFLLDDPSRIVYACWNHDDIEVLAEKGHFRLSLRGQSFLAVSIDMSVDIKLWEEGGKVLCKSTAYSVEDVMKVLGSEFVDSFFFQLEGELSAREVETRVRSLSFKNTVVSGEVGVSTGGKVSVTHTSFSQLVHPSQCAVDS
ncbi:unnamed protein product [Choristocarpus tenellus]